MQNSQNNHSIVIVTIALCLLLNSCSLLKFSADLGMEPLPKEQLNQRVSVRLFAENFTDYVTIAADTIFTLSDDFQIKMNSILWKAGATQSCVKSAVSSLPESSLLNMWILVEGMDRFFQRDSTFDKYQNIATTTSAEIVKKYKKIPTSYLSKKKYNLMNTFVDSVLISNPVNLDFRIKDYTVEWLQYTNVPDTAYVSTVGSISEVISDLGDKMSLYSVDAQNQLSWFKDRTQFSIKQGLADSVTRARLDSLDITMVVLRKAIQHAPETVDTVMDMLSLQLKDLMNEFNVTVTNSIGVISKERLEVEKYVTEEREAILNEARAISQDSIKQVTDAIPAIIKSVLLYVIIFLIILLGVPFTIGFMLGKVFRKKKE